MLMTFFLLRAVPFFPLADIYISLNCIKHLVFSNPNRGTILF